MIRRETEALLFALSNLVDRDSRCGLCRTARGGLPAEGDLDEYLRIHQPVALDDPYAGTKALEETREEPDYGV